MALFADDIRLAEPGRRCIHDLACATQRSGPGLRCHGDHRTPPTRFDLSGREEPVYIATQRWALEPWEGEDPPSLAKIWSRKPKFAVNGSRSCAELAIVHLLRNEGWHGVWVNSFGPRELRSEWFPAPAAKMLAETGAPSWVVEIFDCLRAANGGTLGGFFDVFAFGPIRMSPRRPSLTPSWTRSSGILRTLYGLRGARRDAPPARRPTAGQTS